MTQEELASNWRKPERLGGGTYSQTHVSFVNKMWDRFHYLGNKPDWNDAYHAADVRGNGAHVGGERFIHIATSSPEAEVGTAGPAIMASTTATRSEV